MARIAIFAVLFIMALLFWMAITAVVVEGHHTGVACSPSGEARCLPLMERSAARAELRNTKSLAYCFNLRAATYPSFRSQVREVMNNHEAELGIRWIEIPGSYETATQAKTAGCEVMHFMPETHGCGSCAGWVHYLNWPVLIEYKWQLGYQSWHTTISHEVVHVYGLHEHYDDARFLSHRNSYGYWAHGLNRSPGTSSDHATVMDFGTGQWRMTVYDVKYACQSIDPNSAIFVACGAQQEPCRGGTFPTWDWCIGRWFFADGVSVDPGLWIWFNPFGEAEWMNCNQFHCWNLIIQRWVPRGQSLYDPAKAYWSTAP